MELYYEPVAANADAAAADADGAALLQRILEGQAAYFSEALSQSLKPLAEKPADQQVVAQEVVSVGGEEGGSATFRAVLAALPGSSALRLVGANDGVQAMSLS